MSQKERINETIIRDIAEKLNGIELGTVTISIYDSRIVQVEITTTRKERFDDVWLMENGAGI